MNNAELLEHAKAIKEYCKQKENEPCDGCPFHFYLKYTGICVLNYGLYPNEWYDPNKAESEEV